MNNISREYVDRVIAELRAGPNSGNPVFEDAADLIEALAAKTQTKLVDDFPSSEDILDKAKNEGRNTYRLGLARTLNPYMSVVIRDAWFAGYDDGASC